MTQDEEIGPIEGIDPSAASPTERAFRILELIASAGTLGIGEIIASLGIPRPTVSRIVSGLENYGYLKKASGRGRYVIGPKLIGVAENILRATANQAPGDAVLIELCHRIGETCSLGVMRGGEVVYLSSVASNAPLTLQFQAGQSAPLHCTSSGHLFLSDMNEHQFEAYLKSGPWMPYTSKSITDPDKLKKTITSVRKAGYATNDSGFVMGVVGIAVPINGRNGSLVACLSVSAPAVRKSIADLERWLPQLKEAAKRIFNSMLDI